MEIKLYGLMADPVSKAPVMVLKADNCEKLIPIWIGTFEANAISMELEKIPTPRPMTHDLISSILLSLNGDVDKVVISDMEGSTFFAKLYIKKGADLKIIDCRPSDAVAIALKYNSTMYISKAVYDSYTISEDKTGFLNCEERMENWYFSLSSEKI